MNASNVKYKKSKKENRSLFIIIIIFQILV